jgi:hypothetical protein
LVNVLLFFGARRFFPDASALPEFTAQRKDLDSIVAQHGVEPFTLQRPESAEVRHEFPTRISSRRSSLQSIDTLTPLRPT